MTNILALARQSHTHATAEREVRCAEPDPFAPDDPSDAPETTKRRQLLRVATIAAMTATRFALERVDEDPIEWLTSPRPLFDGAAALDACQHHGGFVRAVLLHGLSLDLDGGERPASPTAHRGPSYSRHRELLKRHQEYSPPIARRSLLVATLLLPALAGSGGGGAPFRGGPAELARFFMTNPDWVFGKLKRQLRGDNLHRRLFVDVGALKAGGGEESDADCLDRLGHRPAAVKEAPMVINVERQITAWAERAAGIERSMRQCATRDEAPTLLRALIDRLSRQAPMLTGDEFAAHCMQVVDAFFEREDDNTAQSGRGRQAKTRIMKACGLTIPTPESAGAE